VRLFESKSSIQLIKKIKHLFFSLLIKARERIDRAESLYKNAQSSFDRKDYLTIKPKIPAARNMGDKAREALSEARNSG